MSLGIRHTPFLTFAYVRMWIILPTRDLAHTFSCILVLNLIAKIKDRNLSLRFYSLACVNMSKIF